MNDTSIEAQVDKIVPLTNTILQLILRPECYVDYIAGQYLQIIHKNEAYAYSIANAPLGSHTYELHIRHAKDNPYNDSLLAEIKEKGSVTIRLPEGNCHIEKLQVKKPIIFIAAGTGFSPVKAMIEQLLATNRPEQFELYWGARSQNDLYMDDRVKHWQTHVEHFQYFSHLTSKSGEKLSEKILSRHQDYLNQWQYVLAGPFDMIYEVRDHLVAHGAEVSSMFSDAFSFENH